MHCFGPAHRVGAAAAAATMVRGSGSRWILAMLLMTSLGVGWVGKVKVDAPLRSSAQPLG